MTSNPQMSSISHAPINEMQQWFKNALSELASLPSVERTDALARKLQIS